MNETRVTTTSELTVLLAELIHSAKTTESTVNAALASVGLSMPKWAAIQALAKADESLTLTQLAEWLTCVKSNVTQLVDRLEAEQLMRRTFDPSDRRVIRAELTNKGWEHYEAGRQVMEQSAHQLFGGYSDAEQMLLKRLLQQLG